MRLLLRDLSPGTNYALQLRAVSGEGVSEWSQIFYFTTLSDTIAPKKPANVVGSMSGTSFILKWDAVTQSVDNTAADDLDHYRVFVQSSMSANTSSFVVHDTKFEFTLEMNREVFGSPVANVQMAVQAVDKAGNTDGYTVFVSQTNPAPATPTGLTVASGTNQIMASWNANTEPDLKQYIAYVGTTAGFTPGSGNKVWEGVGTSFVYPTVGYSTTFYVKVVAVDVFDTPSATPASAGPISPSNPVGVDSTAPSVPTGLSASMANSADESYATATVSWTAVTDTDNDLSEYIIGYRPVGVTDWQYTKVDYTNTSTKITGLLPYTDYEFRIRSSDFSANLSGWSSTVTATKQANGAPSTPAAPTAASSTMQVQVSHNGQKAAGGAMEGDVVLYEVYGSTTTGFTPAAANMLGAIDAGPAIVGTFPLPATGGGATQTWYIKVIAVDRGGLKSSASAQTTATPSLIADANIVNATITSAKIASLEANKITAGTGLINDITVKSKLTLGDASTVGAIESYGYAAGTTGFRFDKNLLEINQGSIKAAALLIQDSNNLALPQFASWEFTPSFYTDANNLYQGPSWATVSCQTSGGKFGPQYGRIEVTGSTSAATTMYMAPTQTTYNLQLEPSTTYIYSVWLKTGTVATSGRIRIRDSSGTITDVSSFSLPASGGWQQVYGTYTANANSTVILMVTIDTLTIGARVDVDGVQIERKVAGLNTPSPWTPPGITSLDGAVIRTGEIRSTTTVTVNGVSQPAWSINMSGGAQFGSANVRGSLIVGPAGADTDAGQSFISSGNYVADTTGWKIDSAGNAEFNTGKIRGNAIVDGTLTTQKLAANSVTADKVALGVIRSNLIQDPSFEEDYVLGDFGAVGENTGLWRKYDDTDTGDIVEKVKGTARSGSGSVRLKCDGFGSVSVMSNSFPILNGVQYRVQFSAIATGTSAILTFSVMSGNTPTGVNDFFDRITAVNDTSPPYTVTNKALTSNVATLTTAEEHDYVIGDSIQVSNVDATFDGWYTVSAVTTNTVSYSKTASNVASTAATGKIEKNLKPPVVTLPITGAEFSTYTFTFTGTAKPYAAIRFTNLFGGGSSIYIDDVSVVPVGIGGAAELTAAGLRLFQNDGTEIGAFVSNRPNYFSVTNNDGVVASIDSNGVGTFSDLNMLNDPSVDGIPFFGNDIRENQYDYFPMYDNTRDLALDPVGLVEAKSHGYVGEAWYSNSDFTNTTVVSGGKLLLFQIDVQTMQNRQYCLVTTPITFNVTSAGGRVALVATRTLNGTQPSSTSTIITRVFTDASITGWHTLQIAYRPMAGSSVQEDTRVLLYLQAESCSFQMINNSDPVGAAIIDLGFAKNRTGTLRNQYIAPSGSDPTAPTTKKTYTSSWIASNSESYGNFGARPEADLYQGYYSSNQGHQWASIVFASANSKGGEVGKTIASALSGATVKKVELYLKNNHWYYNSGGTAYVRAQNSTSLITSTPTGTPKAFSGWAKGAGKWVDITSISSASIRGVTLGKAPSTSLTYYGQFANHTSSSKPQLRITYEK